MFPAPAELLSLNDRTHWAAKSESVAAWRRAAYYAACADWPVGEAARTEILEAGVWEVKVVLPVPDRRRRDPHNFVATVKPVVDGLVDAGLWPDDTPEYVTVPEPQLIKGATAVLVVLTRQEQQ